MHVKRTPRARVRQGDRNNQTIQPVLYLKSSTTPSNTQDGTKVWTHLLKSSLLPSYLEKFTKLIQHLLTHQARQKRVTLICPLSRRSDSAWHACSVQLRVTASIASADAPLTPLIGVLPWSESVEEHTTISHRSRQQDPDLNDSYFLILLGSCPYIHPAASLRCSFKKNFIVFLPVS